MSPAADERGQSSVLAIGVVMVVVAIALALVGLAAELTARGRAQAVADLTALAATWGDDPARDVATRNRATLVSVEHRGTNATVVVELGGHRAAATADR